MLSDRRGIGDLFGRFLWEIAKISTQVAEPSGVTGGIPNSRIDGLSSGDHICHIFESREEQISLASRFLQKGLAEGEKCFFVTEENGTKKAIKELESFGLKTKNPIASKALLIVECGKVYYQDGRFNPDTLIYGLKERVSEATSNGYSGVRAVGGMAWSLNDIPGSERLMEYEARMNYLFPKIKFTGICQYDIKKFDTEFLINAIQTHPIVLYRSADEKNRYYMPPDEFLVSESIGITSELTKEKPLSRKSNQIKTKFKKSLKKYSLTKQELRVVDLILLCKSNKEVSEVLFISVNTVKQHIKNIFKKIGIHSRIEFISHFMKEINRP